MHYIVFDLEWNQCPDEKEKQQKPVPFEIIEIGAVKLDRDRNITDEFHTLVRPKIYTSLHRKIQEVVPIEYDRLKQGRAFPRAAIEFLNWCGEDAVFCTWGNQDLTELQRNMKFYQILGLLDGPVIYYDVQKIFGIAYETKGSRRSLEHAITVLNLSKDEGFHRALADARYTARILQEIPAEIIRLNYSIDVYQNPKKRKDEIYLVYSDYEKYISREFESKEKVMKDKVVTNVICPLCKHPAKRKIRWFAANSKQHLSVSVCPKHGMLKGKIRIKHTDEGAYYGIKTVRQIDEHEFLKIQERQEVMRLKRQMKRKA